MFFISVNQAIPTPIEKVKKEWEMYNTIISFHLKKASEINKKLKELSNLSQTPRCSPVRQQEYGYYFSRIIELENDAEILIIFQEELEKIKNQSNLESSDYFNAEFFEKEMKKIRNHFYIQQILAGLIKESFDIKEKKLKELQKEINRLCPQKELIL
jgi:hypothetical protein